MPCPAPHSSHWSCKHRGLSRARRRSGRHDSRSVPRVIIHCEAVASRFRIVAVCCSGRSITIGSQDLMVMEAVRFHEAVKLLAPVDPASTVIFMAHIDLQNQMPGILGLLRFRPSSAMPLMELAEVLLRGESPLGRGERELIAAQVSKLNRCQFCYNAHGTHAALQLDGGWDSVDADLAGVDGAPLSDKLRSCCGSPPQCRQVDTRSLRRWSTRQGPLVRAMSRSTTWC